MESTQARGSNRTRVASAGHRPAEAQRILGIGRTKLYELLGSGQLRAVKIGRSTFVLQDSIDQLLSSAPEFKSRANEALTAGTRFHRSRA